METAFQTASLCRTQLYCLAALSKAPRDKSLKKVREGGIAKIHEGLKINVVLHLTQDSIVPLMQCVNPDGRGSLSN